MLSYLLSLYNVLGPQNRTLHLYVVRPTNLLVFGLSRANTETSYSCGLVLVVVVSVVGGGENFSDGEISKTTTVGPL